MKETQGLYGERHPLLSKENAMVEATRCINCYDAPCIDACPSGINIPQFISRIANGDLEGSAQSILESNILGHSCATVCPVEVLCEGSCVYNNLEDPPIRIGDLQRFATDNFLQQDSKKQLASLHGSKGNGRAPAKQKIKVAAIGGGPASLSFAAYICLNGGEADVFEKDKQPGGLNTYGIAPYKLSYEESLKEVEFIKNIGVKFHCGKEVGKDIKTDELLKEYDAVFIGCGLGEDSFPLPSAGMKNVFGSLPLIASLKEKNKGAISGAKSALVVGGGNTALDVAQELALSGVPKVILAYRRTEKDMSGYAHELKVARSLGVEFLTQHTPSKLVADKDKASAMEFETPQGKSKIPADVVFFATGQKKHPLQEIFPKLKTNDNGTVAVDGKMQTNIDKLYAGGDCVNNGKEVVNAVAEGRDAARNVLLSNNKEVYYGRFSD